QVIALAIVLGAAEHGVRDVRTWQSAEGRYWASPGVPLAARYLAWLAEHSDYTLSDIEAEVAAHAADRSASGPSEPAGEAGPGAARPNAGDPVTGPGWGGPEQESDAQDQPPPPPNPASPAAVPAWSARAGTCAAGVGGRFPLCRRPRQASPKTPRQ